MKAHRENTFIPVTLILETQAEVDGIFALMNHTNVSAAAGLPEDAYEALQPFKRGNYVTLHENLDKLINKRK